MAFLKGTDAKDEEIINSLQKLRNRLVKEYSGDEILGVPKMVWKTRSAYQCLIRRIIDAADSVRVSWNSNNMLATITMARSLFETAAVIRLMRDACKEAVKTKSVENLDKKVMEVLFSARHKFFAESVKAAQKVHQWPQGKYISLRVGGNGGLASCRGSARGISASPLH